jgi:16S rRNA (guanine966-N2)-methyltransferase
MPPAGNVRIIGGAWRGRKLIVPPATALRPTADRAREALFNRLLHGFVDRGFRLVGATVADVCAGTGAMGFEALSRGAAMVTFIERDAGVAAAIEAQISAFAAEDRARVVRGDAAAPPPATRACDLVIIDPPFASGTAEPALRALGSRGWYAPNALVVVETDADKADPTPHGLTVIDSRTYGRIKFLFYAAENLPQASSATGRSSSGAAGAASDGARS